MKSMNLLGDSVPVSENHYPYTDNGSEGEVLHLSSGLEICWQGNDLIRLDGGSKVIGATLAGLPEFLNQMKAIDAFQGDYTHVPGCLLMNAILEVAGDSDTWEYLMMNPAVLQAFFKNFWSDFSVDDTYFAVKPLDKRNWSPDWQNELAIILMPGVRAIGVLRMARDKVYLDVPARRGDTQWDSSCIEFPPYNPLWFVTSYEYYRQMWSHLWRQLLLSYGIECDGGDFRYSLSLPTDQTGAFGGAKDIFIAKGPHDVARAVATLFIPETKCGLFYDKRMHL